MKAMFRKNYEKPKIYKREAVMHVCLCQSISGITHSLKGAITLVNAIAKIHTKWSNFWKEQVTIPFAFFITKKTQNFGFFKRRLEPFSSVRRGYTLMSVRLWNFKDGGSLNPSFLPKNHHAQRKPVYFENTGSTSSSNIGRDFRK